MRVFKRCVSCGLIRLMDDQVPHLCDECQLDIAVETQCGWARNAGYGCKNDPIHVIGAHDDAGNFHELRLCHDHFLVALEMGLIDEPFLGDEKFEERKQEGPP